MASSPKTRQLVYAALLAHEVYMNPHTGGLRGAKDRYQFNAAKCRRDVDGLHDEVRRLDKKRNLMKFVENVACKKYLMRSGSNSLKSLTAPQSFSTCGVTNAPMPKAMVATMAPTRYPRNLIPGANSTQTARAVQTMFAALRVHAGQHGTDVVPHDAIQNDAEPSASLPATGPQRSPQAS